jgi:hypothetical protein
MGAPGNKYFSALLNLAKLRVQGKDYQSVGSLMYKELYNESNIEQLVASGEVVNMSINVMCPSRAVPGLFMGSAREYKGAIVQETIGFHWYGGHPYCGEMQNKITEETYKNFDNIICWLINKVLVGERV